MSAPPDPHAPVSGLVAGGGGFSHARTTKLRFVSVRERTGSAVSGSLPDTLQIEPLPALEGPGRGREYSWEGPCFPGRSRASGGRAESWCPSCPMRACPRGLSRPSWGRITTPWRRTSELSEIRHLTPSPDRSPGARTTKLRFVSGRERTSGSSPSTARSTRHRARAKARRVTKPTENGSQNGAIGTRPGPWAL